MLRRVVAIIEVDEQQIVRVFSFVDGTSVNVIGE